MGYPIFKLNYNNKLNINTLGETTCIQLQKIYLKIRRYNNTRSRILSAEIATYATIHLDMNKNSQNDNNKKDNTDNTNWFTDWTARTGLRNIANTVMNTIHNNSHRLLSSAEQQKINDYLAAAKQQAAATNYQDALKSVNDALKIQPDLSTTLNAASKIYLAANTYLDDAEELALAAVQNTSNTLEKVEYYDTLNSIYHQLKEYQKAIDINTQALAQLKALAPSTQTTEMQVMHLRQLGTDYVYHTNTPEKAIPYLQEALNLQPNDVDLHYKMAKAYQHQEEHDLAISWFKKALEVLDKDDLDTNAVFNYQTRALCNLGRSCIEIKDYERATFFLHENKQLDDTGVKVNLHLAVLAAHFGQAQEMEKYLLTAIHHARSEDWIREEYSQSLIERVTPYPNCKSKLLDILLQHKKIADFTYKVHRADALQQALADKDAIKKELKQLIRENEYDTVINKLLEFTALSKQKQLYDDIILLSSQYDILERESQIGILSPVDYHHAIIRTNRGVISIINRM